MFYMVFDSWGLIRGVTRDPKEAIDLFLALDLSGPLSPWVEATRLEDFG